MDQATLSPPEGYKDAAALALGGALGGHVFGAQHIQQLQVIQRLQQQRAAMLAARNSQQPNNGVAATPHPSQSATTTLPTNASSSSQSPYNQVCTECAECAECAAKQDEGKIWAGKIWYLLKIWNLNRLDFIFQFCRREWYRNFPI